MLAALKSLLKADARVAPSHIGRLTYAIGDIHGRDDLFEKMLLKIREDAGDERPQIVLLGDYVDRGAASRQVLDRILVTEKAGWCDLVVLVGNHEDTMLQFLVDPGVGPSWMEYGGLATLASYGLSAPPLSADYSVWEELRDKLREALPPTHVALLRRMCLYFEADDYFFVHAGVSPDLPREDQGPEEFLWIRGPFLDARKACDLVVVHGHTPEVDMTNDRWRIGLDTGAYATGVLTAIRLKGDTRRVLEVR